MTGTCLNNEGQFANKMRNKMPQVVRDPCQPNPCQYNGKCLNQNGKIVFQCTQGYSGQRCENHGQVDPCSPSPCQNGQCLCQAGQFVCQCPTGYSRQRCENRALFDACANTPCHSGKCFLQGGQSVSGSPRTLDYVGQIYFGLNFDSNRHF